MIYSTRPIYSNNYKQYCPGNAALTLIADHGNVLIVEYMGSRFPVKVRDVSEVESEIVEQVVRERVKKPGKSKQVVKVKSNELKLL